MEDIWYSDEQARVLCNGAKRLEEKYGWDLVKWLSPWRLHSLVLFLPPLTSGSGFRAKRYNPS